MKTKNVEFIKSPGKFRLGYFEGERAVMEEKQAEELIKHGYARELGKGSKTNLPEDLPGRDAIAAAGLSLDELAEISEYTDITGIGKGTAEKLNDYFKQK